MTGRAAALQGGLAALGLITAHLTWHRDPDRAPGDVKVVDASKSDVARIHYEDESNVVDLMRSGGGDPIWVHLVEKPKAPPAAAPHDKDKPPPAPPAPPPPRDVLGSDAALSLYEKFTPLLSPRGFGALEAAKLKEIGLDAPKRKLAITVKGDTRQFELGQAPGSSTGEWFMRELRDGRVYLVPRGVVSELQNAAHMVDRRLHVFELGDYDRITITVNGKSKEYLHLGKETLATEGFAPLKTPDKRDQMAKNWHDMLWRLFPTEVLGKGETPSDGTPRTVLRVDYRDGKSSVGWLELGRTEPAGATTSEEGNAQASQLYARSEHTVNWAKLHSGKEVVTDAEKLVASP